MSSPFPTLFICVVYVYFVKSLGPRLMANRRPFELKTAVKIYNILQVIVSTYLVYGVGYSITFYYWFIIKCWVSFSQI